MQMVSCFIKKVFSFFIFWLACFCVAAQVPATNRGVIVTSETTEKAVTGDVYAIITGVSNYPGINPLKYADKDALLFRDFLKTPNGGNTKPENILSLINDSAKAAIAGATDVQRLTRITYRPPSWRMSSTGS